MTEELKPQKWYVVKAIAGKEKKAKEYIENERVLSDSFIYNREVGSTNNKHGATQYDNITQTHRKNRLT